MKNEFDKLILKDCGERGVCILDTMYYYGQVVFKQRMFIRSTVITLSKHQFNSTNKSSTIYGDATLIGGRSCTQQLIRVCFRTLYHHSAAPLPFKLKRNQNLFIDGNV